jgi:hypothetical protein
MAGRKTEGKDNKPRSKARKVRFQTAIHWAKQWTSVRVHNGQLIRLKKAQARIGRRDQMAFSIWKPATDIAGR